MSNIRFKVNFDKTEYILENHPDEINHVNYIVFPTLDKEVTVYVPNFIKDNKSYIEQLKQVEKVAYIDNNLKELYLEDIFEDMDDDYKPDTLDWVPFDDEFFNTYFDDPYEAARAVFFGDIKNWNDDYIRFNAYRNLESTNTIDYENYDEEIIENWVCEKIEE